MNNLFNSKYSSSNPFAMQRDLDNSILDNYTKLEELKQQQIQKMAKISVFTDIDNELKDLQADEISFIVSSERYQELNNKYQDEFSRFLLNKFSTEFLQVTNTRTPEEILYEIRSSKERYRNKFSEDINEIKNQNKTLVEQNNALVTSNQELQEQLTKIQEKLKWTE